MRTITIAIIVSVALMGCKKEDPKPEPVATPSPITSAATSFNLKVKPGTSGSLKLDWTLDQVGSNPDKTILTFDPNGNAWNEDTTVTLNITHRRIAFYVSAAYPVTINISNQYKSYSFTDSTEKGIREVDLW